MPYPHSTTSKVYFSDCRAIQKALIARRPYVRYAIIADRLAKWTLPLLLPVRLVDWLLASTLKMLPKNLPQSIH